MKQSERQLLFFALFRLVGGMNVEKKDFYQMPDDEGTSQFDPLAKVLAKEILRYLY